MTELSAPRWTWRTGLAAAAFTAFLAVQLVVPISMLAVRGGHVGTGELPQTGELPFSWQMYTVIPPPGRIVVVDRDGVQHELDAAGTLGIAGSRMAYDPEVLSTACASIPNSIKVSVVIVSVERSATC